MYLKLFKIPCQCLEVCMLYQ